MARQGATQGLERATSPREDIALVGIAHESDLLRRGIESCLEEDPLTKVVFSIEGGKPTKEAEVVVASPQALESGRYTCPVVLCVSDAAAMPHDSTFVAAVVPWPTVTPRQLTASVRAVSVGFRLQLELDRLRLHPDFDQRGIEVLRLLAAGATTRTISETLFYSERTVKAIIQGLERGLSAATRAQAVAEALRRGLI